MVSVWYGPYGSADPGSSAGRSAAGGGSATWVGRGPASTARAAAGASSSPSRVATLRKPCTRSHAASFGLSGSQATSRSTGVGSGASARSFTSSREIRAFSACSISASRRLEGFIAGAAASTVSRSPNSLMSWAAPFGPMPGTPGTLSTESPISACTSTILSGVTPNFSITSGGPIGFCLIGSSISTPGRMSCIRSLSDDTIVTCPPACSAATA